MNKRLCQLCKKIRRHVLQNFSRCTVLTGNRFLNSEFIVCSGDEFFRLKRIHLFRIIFRFQCFIGAGLNLFFGDHQAEYPGTVGCIFVERRRIRGENFVPEIERCIQSIRECFVFPENDFTGSNFAHFSCEFFFDAFKNFTTLFAAKLSGNSCTFTFAGTFHAAFEFQFRKLIHVRAFRFVKTASAENFVFHALFFIGGEFLLVELNQDEEIDDDRRNQQQNPVNEQDTATFAEKNNDTRYGFDGNQMELSRFHIGSDFRTCTPCCRDRKDDRDKAETVFQNQLDKAHRCSVTLNRIRHKQNTEDEEEQQSPEHV